MASSLFVNTLQVEFDSVFAMEHTGMTHMFKSLEDTGLKGFLKGTTFVFENAVTEFFINARVIAGTIIRDNRSWDIPKETIVEMSSRFSATDVPFREPSKKREMQIEYRLLHDIVAKSLCAKVGSFDTVTCEKFEFMVAISAGISVEKNFISKAVKYGKESQEAISRIHGAAGESSKRTEDTASNTEGGETQLAQPAVTETLAAAKENGVDKPKKRKTTDAEQKKKTKKATEMEKQTVVKPSVARTNLDSETSSDKDSCPLVTCRRRRPQVTEPSVFDDTTFLKTLQKNPTTIRSQRIPSTAQKLKSEQKAVATMCVSIWELPNRLSTRYQVHKQRSTCCCPTHEMWELPTPLTVANSPSREMRDGSYPRASTSTLARSISKHKARLQEI
ncbi:hypothetical protein F511_30412 [Dorcoceras hygrometricum]|uniref:Uncharacterized protein n=1 Tax=Dorcoceras hygrometricum TaxID=472368 RepID=A0A2Z7AX09_9LAMI|nr:hypothetical protein F511_30412 [Dorcoceras hygrometricum]